jgi:hypothetical protein
MDPMSPVWTVGKWSGRPQERSPATEFFAQIRTRDAVTAPEKKTQRRDRLRVVNHPCICDRLRPDLTALAIH